MMVIQKNVPDRRHHSAPDRRFISDERFSDIRSNVKPWDSLPEILQRLVITRQSFVASIAMPALLVAACTPPNSDEPTSKTGDAGSISQVSDDAGARLFIQCKACHALERGAGHAVGPNLFGILGSRAGSNEGFVYSAAMKDADLIWTPQNLDRFLKNPNEVVRGTSMTFAGLTDPQKRDQLVKYISEHR